MAFAIDAFVRRIVGWRTSRTAHMDFVLDAIEQAIHDRRPVHRGGFVYHSDRGSQYLLIKYSERSAETSIEPSVEFATLEWVDWFNNRRLMRPIGKIPPAEAEERYYCMLGEPVWAA